MATAVRRAAAAVPSDPFEHERGWWERGCVRLAGVDEAGRGPLAGPVVAAAVILPPDCWVEGAADSKKLDTAAREEILPRILAAAVCVGIGAASCREIERVNILRATALAMTRAVARLRGGADHLLVDGLPVRELGAERHTAIVDGDEKVHAIACASIVAKVTRDRLMIRLGARYPRYCWERNKGYATPEHLAALAEAGPTPHHRRTFAPVQLTLFPR